MFRSLTMASVRAIGLVIPAAAQQVSDKETRQAAESSVDAYNRAVQKKDAVALAALFTEDAILIIPEGSISGRAAIEKGCAEGFKVYTQTEPSKLDQVKVISKGVRITVRAGAGRRSSRPKRSHANKGPLGDYRCA